MSQCPNVFPRDVLARIESRLRPVRLSSADVAAETDRSTAKVYFPFSDVALDWIRRYALGR